jgi:hypothetical protein
LGVGLGCVVVAVLLCFVVVGVLFAAGRAQGGEVWVSMPLAPSCVGMRVGTHARLRAVRCLEAHGGSDVLSGGGLVWGQGLCVVSVATMHGLGAVRSL